MSGNSYLDHINEPADSTPVSTEMSESQDIATLRKLLQRYPDYAERYLAAKRAADLGEARRRGRERDRPVPVMVSREELRTPPPEVIPVEEVLSP